MNKYVILIAILAIFNQSIQQTDAKALKKVSKRSALIEHQKHYKGKIIADIVSKAIDTCILECEEEFGYELNDNLNDVNSILVLFFKILINLFLRRLKTQIF